MPPKYQKLIDNAVIYGVITPDQYLQIPWHERESMQYLFSYDGRCAVNDGIITPDQYLQIPWHERESMQYLFSFQGRKAVAEGFITLQRYLQIPLHDRRNVMTALSCGETQERIMYNEITLESIIGHPNGVAVPNINGAQSTHTSSVHQSVSESVTQLANLYKSNIDDFGLENIIGEVQAYIDNLPDDSQKNIVAKRGFLRIVAPDYTFTDPVSQVSTRELIALEYVAIHDDENRIGSLENAEMQFVEALYEIQRGYNLSPSGVDKGGNDRYICSGGVFNKFIEKLVGIHPACQVLLITSEIATFKLCVVVREEAMRYLATLTNFNAAKALSIFTHTIEQVKKEGVGVIWHHIKDQVATRMFDEFGSLYRNMVDSDFTGLIEAGKGVELNNLNIFQEKIQSSDLNKHRHDDAETEKAEAISLKKTFSVEESKNVELDNLTIFKEIALQLDKLENKAKNLRDRQHILAYCKAANIVRLLRSLNNDYLTKKIDYKTFKETSLDIIEQERPELDKHRGYKHILGNLFIFIATLGTGQLINKACNGTFLFFNKTASRKRIDKLSHMIEKMEFNYQSLELY